VVTVCAVFAWTCVYICAYQGFPQAPRKTTAVHDVNNILF